jgi:4a-hydroxytetrahydrobiopterin dehydratase
MQVNVVYMVLTEQKCQACEGGVPPLTTEEINSYAEQLHDDWMISEDELWIEREVTFEDFKQALEFVNNVGDIAEAEGHHPDMQVGYGYAVVFLSTHAIDGLSSNDFIMAAKIDQLV